MVMSDMCHATTGISIADAARSLQLADLACSVALGTADTGTDGVLVPGGNLLVKILEVRADHSALCMLPSGSLACRHSAYALSANVIYTDLAGWRLSTSVLVFAGSRDRGLCREVAAGLSKGQVGAASRDAERVAGEVFARHWAAVMSAQTACVVYTGATVQCIV